MVSAEHTIRPVRAIGRLDPLHRDQLIIALFVLASCVFLFVDTRVPPVALQDEARNANNAIEMYLRGFSLVTTYNFQPDLWNTKPPLLIWLMTGSMHLFGPSEWAIRVPSALAALGTLICTLYFVRRVTGSLTNAVGAGLILLLSPGFFGEHGARTADFDATLTFFVTAALQLAFFAIHRSKPANRSMWALGGLIAAGALTKSIAAFIPATGVLVYLIATGRLGRTISHWPRYLLAGAVAIAPLLIFYALREVASPGYVDAVVYNDIVGRFSGALNLPTSPSFYLRELILGWSFAGPFLVVAPLAFARLSGRTRLLFLYAASVACTALVVYSAASNRAVQYALPIFPWLSIVGVLTLRYLVQIVLDSWRSGKAAQALVVGAGIALTIGSLTYLAADWRYNRFPKRDFYPESSYGDLFKELSARGVTHVTVVDPGFMHLGKPGYIPLLRWNYLIWQQKGMHVDHQYVQERATRGPLATCAPRIVKQWAGSSAEKVGSCALLSRTVAKRR